MTEFDAEITRIDMNHEDTNKSFVIQVTDQELLDTDRRNCTGNEWKSGDSEWKICRSCHACVCAGFYRRLWDFCRNDDEKM